MGRSERWMSRGTRSYLLGGSVACLLACTPSAFAQDASSEVIAQESDVVDTPDTTEQEAELTQEETDAGQAALTSELASAKRFETELDGLLSPNGRLDTSQPNASAKLRSLATRCGILANSAMHDEVRLVLLGYQARALAALASQHAEDQDEDEAWIDQLSDTAQQIAAIGLPGAAATADYWLLIAEITQHAESKLSPTRRHARIEQALRVFIENYAEDPDAGEYLLDARLVLAQLMDQRGAQRDVKKRLDQLRDQLTERPNEQSDNSSRISEVNRLAQSVARLGTPIDFESVSTQLTRWRASDHAGKPLLIHVYADSVKPSVHMIDVISRSIVEGSLSGIAVVSLRVGEPINGTNTPPWPTLPVQLEPNGVLDMLGVTALPTLAWLDEQGRLAAIGTTPAVLDQLKNIVPPAPKEDTAAPVQIDEAPPAAQDPASDPAPGSELDPAPNPDAELPADEPADSTAIQEESSSF